MKPFGRRTLPAKAKFRPRQVKGRMNGIEAEYALLLEAQKQAGEIADYKSSSR